MTKRKIFILKDRDGFYAKHENNPDNHTRAFDIIGKSWNTVREWKTLNGAVRWITKHFPDRDIMFENKIIK